MKTLHRHLREMLLALDAQAKLPNTKIYGGVWIDIEGPICVMCAAGAWYAQQFGHRDIICFNEISGPVERTLLVMDFLRVFNVAEAYEQLHWRDMYIGLPYNIAGGDSLAMDAEWRVAQEKLLIWLTANNL